MEAYGRHLLLDFTEQRRQVVTDRDMAAIRYNLNAAGIPCDTVTPQQIRDVVMDVPSLLYLYEHVTELWCRLTGNMAPALTPQQITQCEEWFSVVAQWCRERQGMGMHTPTPYCLGKFLKFLVMHSLVKFVHMEENGTNAHRWQNMYNDLQRKGQHLMNEQRHSIQQSASRMLLPELCNLIGAYARPRWTLGFVH